MKRRQAVEWNLLFSGNIGFSEKEALVIIEPELPAELVLAARVDVFRQQLDLELPMRKELPHRGFVIPFLNIDLGYIGKFGDRADLGAVHKIVQGDRVTVVGKLRDRIHDGPIQSRIAGDFQDNTFPG